MSACDSYRYYQTMDWNGDNPEDRHLCRCGQPRSRHQQPGPSERPRTIELDAYEMANLLALLQVAGYDTPSDLRGLNLATGDWIGTVYWKVLAASKEFSLPAPNLSVEDQLARVRQ